MNETTEIKDDFDLAKIKLTISEPRIQPYLLATRDGNDFSMAIQLYQYNIQLCESLYSSLHTFEITFRNKLTQSLISNYGEMWHSNQSSLFFEEQEIEQLNKRDVIAENKIIGNDYKCYSYNRKIDITKLSLGFWTSLLTKNIYKQSIFVKCISEVFPYAQASDRNTLNVSNKLKIAQRLRNKVFHYERIWKSDYNVYQKHQTIHILIKWMCPDTLKWMKCHDQFPHIYARLAHLRTP